MAVAGAPVPMEGHAAAAVGMANEILAGARTLRWPSGDPIAVRGGVASGPVVAGVIGERKFAYDVWGDTVNLASRLEEHGEPGQILVSQVTATESDGPIRVRARPDARPQRQRRDARAPPARAGCFARRRRTLVRDGDVVRRSIRGRHLRPFSTTIALVLAFCVIAVACTPTSPDDTGDAAAGQGKRSSSASRGRSPRTRSSQRCTRRFSNTPDTRSSVSSICDRGSSLNPPSSPDRSISNPSTCRRSCCSSIASGQASNDSADVRPRPGICSRPGGSRC